VKGEQTDVLARGFYIPTPSSFDVNVDLHEFDIRLLEPLSFGQLKNAKGST
jgi:hypothetical protein